MSLETNEEWAPDDFGPKTNLHYGEATSLLAFLIASPKGRRFLQEVYRLVDEGHNDIYDRIPDASLRKLEEFWHQDIQRRIEVSRDG